MQSSKQNLAQTTLKALAISAGGPLVPKEKNEAAVPLGRLGGLNGDKARSESLFPDARREMAQKAAKARWASWASKKAL
jgi:hypothetical protein